MKEKFVVSIIFPFITQLVLLFAKYILFLKLDAQIMGDWLFLNSSISLGFFFSYLGFDLIHYQYSGKDNFDDYLGSYFAIKILLIIVNIISTILLTHMLGLYNIFSFSTILFMILGEIVFNINSFLTVALYAKKKFIITELIQFSTAVIKNIFVIFIAFNIDKFINPIGSLALIRFSTEFISLFFLLIVAKKEIRFNKPKKIFIISYLKSTKLIIIESILLGLISNLGNVLLYQSKGNESLAHFQIAYMFIFLILRRISLSVKPICYVLYSQYFYKKDINSIKKIVYTLEKLFSILNIGFLIIFLINGELIVSLLLPQYISSVSIIYIMILIPYLNGIGRPYEFLMIPGEKQKTYAIYNIIVICFTIILLFLFIPESVILFIPFGWGSYGFAFTLLIPEVISCIMYHHYSKKYFNINSQKKIFLHLLIGLITFSISFFLKEYIFIIFLQNELLLIISSIVTICLFIILLIIFKELNKTDLTFLRDLINISKYKKSLRDEIT
ncbi:MAG: lipopolysaccharide biosynthesis protein [Promethearchaeota archaeon]